VNPDEAAKKYGDPDGFSYYNEYDVWVPRLSIDKSEPLRMLDIGSDKMESLRRYLTVNGYNITKYTGYELQLGTPFTRNDRFEFYGDYNFIKMDCEGCEYAIFHEVNVSELHKMFDNKYVIIALHNNGMFAPRFDKPVSDAIKQILPYKLFETKDGFEVMYTNVLLKY